MENSSESLLLNACAYGRNVTVATLRYQSQSGPLIGFDREGSYASHSTRVSTPTTSISGPATEPRKKITKEIERSFLSI